MDGFETPYEDCVEVDFINCEICNKSIRGETLYKLHVTSQGHLKNEEALIAEGKIPRQQILPVFEDITQYLDYLNLDEPIIGLGFLVEVPGEIGDQSGIKYHCTLCRVYAYITEAVQHVIGRKHRQKYLEKNRPDLVNWDTQRPLTIAGKIIRAKAEIAERQDGQGKPKPLPDKTKRRLLPRFSFEGGPNNGQGSSFTKEMGPTMPKFGSYSKDDYMQERYENTFSNREPLGDSEIYTGHYKPDRESSGYPGVRDYQREDSGNFSDVLALQDQDRRQYGRSQREEPLTDVFIKPPTQKDVLKEFYTEELRREQLVKAQKWPNDIESHHHEHTRRPREMAPLANQSSYPTSIDGKSSHEIYNLIKDYRHDTLGERPHEALSNPGPNRVSPSRSGDFSRKMSNIPDPFMRFLKGEPSDEESKVRKRKSRFSDATPEELQTAHEMLTDNYGPPDPKFSSRRQERRELKTQHMDPPIGVKQTETYHKDAMPECTESTGDVFEMLRNIEIENEEEANFLKERLCSVLREFKARKAEKAAQQGPSRSVEDYSHMRPVMTHTRDRYGRTHRENLNTRRAETPYDEDPSQVSYDEQMLDEDFQEHTHPVLPEARYSDRKPFKEAKRWPNNQPQHAPGYDMPAPGYDSQHLFLKLSKSRCGLEITSLPIISLITTHPHRFSPWNVGQGSIGPLSIQETWIKSPLLSLNLLKDNS
uniref:C2H2-type domain-containing protein n=1 Tax=Neogobius melanostomus TaxID=47308 RepID=A0A8C6TIM7_9GOBI